MQLHTPCHPCICPLPSSKSPDQAAVQFLRAAACKQEICNEQFYSKKKRAVAGQASGHMQIYINGQPVHQHGHAWSRALKAGGHPSGRLPIGDGLGVMQLIDLPQKVYKKVAGKVSGSGIIFVGAGLSELLRASGSCFSTRSSSLSLCKEDEDHMQASMLEEAHVPGWNDGPVQHQSMSNWPSYAKRPVRTCNALQTKIGLLSLCSRCSI